VGISYTVAYYIARFGQRRKALYLALLIAPFFISYLMRMMAWNNLLSPAGYINKILGFLPFAPHHVNWQSGNQFTIIFGLVYGYVPYMVLPLYGFLDRIQTSLLEAGRDLGAGPVQTFFRVTLPLSKQAILAGIVIITLPMFGDYYTHNLLGLDNTTNMIGNLLDEAKSSGLGSNNRVAALCLIIMAIMFIPMAYYLRSTNKELAKK
jgi:spermidine/putrescine transport system permease protein